MRMTTELDRSIEDFYNKNGRDPHYLILSVEGYQILSQELTEDEGLDSDQSFLKDITNYDNMLVSVTHDMNAPKFILA